MVLRRRFLFLCLIQGQLCTIRRVERMEGSKWLSEAIHMENMQSSVLNLVHAPVGCGKTTWALNCLAQMVSNKNRMLYLIDTVNGREQLIKHEDAALYDRDWKERVLNDMVDFENAKVVVMTYAKFGVLADWYPEFGYTFEIILCDELHSLPRFSSFLHKPQDKQYHAIAKKRIEEIINHSSFVKVIGLSATPERLERDLVCPIQYLPVDKDVRQWETKETRPYTNIDHLIDSLSKEEIGLIYVSHIRKMKALVEAAKEKGHRAIAIWSENNTDHPMTEEQKRARRYILDNAELPPEYDLVVINASSETSISIKGRIDYIVIHTQEQETQIQVRGRYRNDLKRLFVLDRNALSVPDEFINRKLFQEDKERLCEILGLRDKNSRLVKWPTVRKKISEKGFLIDEGRENNKRYSVISF